MKNARPSSRLSSLHRPRPEKKAAKNSRSLRSSLTRSLSSNVSKKRRKPSMPTLNSILPSTPMKRL